MARWLFEDTDLGWAKDAVMEREAGLGDHGDAADGLPLWRRDLEEGVVQVGVKLIALQRLVLLNFILFEGLLQALARHLHAFVQGAEHLGGAGDVLLAQRWRKHV